ncbi:MAG: HTH domain-containing protein [Candidatus Bathyarchaeia archaeon]
MGKWCGLLPKGKYMTDGVIVKILDYLRKSAPKDLSIEELAQATGIHRNTVSKYVYALEREGKIMTVRTVGNAKMYVRLGRSAAHTLEPKRLI